MVPFKIEIFDKNSGSAGATFDCDREDPKIFYKQPGLEKELEPGIYPSSCEFNMFIIRNRAINYIADSFFNDLIQGQEDRFTVKIWLAGFVKFIGNIVHDGLEEEDTYESNELISKKVTIRAADGLEKFKTILFEVTGSPGTLYDGNNWETTIKHLQRCFEKLDAKSHYGANEGVFIASDLRENSMAAGDPFDRLGINNQIFLNRTDNDITAKNCYEVLDIICKIHNVVLQSMDGRFFFHSINYRMENSSSITYYWYTINMAPNGTFTLNSSHITKINTYSPVFDLRIVSGKKLIRSPLRSATVIYEHGTGEDFLHGLFIDFFGKVGQDLGVIGQAPVPDDVTRLKLLGTIEILPKWDVADTNRYKIIFYFWIQIGSYYYQREIRLPLNPFLNNGYIGDTEDWVTTAPDGTGQGEYAWQWSQYLRRDFHDDAREPLHFEVLTKPIPQSEDGANITFKLRYEIWDQDNNVDPEDDYTIQIQMEDGQILVVDEETSKVEKSAIRSYVEVASENSLDLTITIPTSDGPNKSAKNRLKIKPSGAETVLWSSGRYTSEKHYDILALELAHARSSPRKIGEYIFYTYADLWRVFEYCGFNHIFMGGSFLVGILQVRGLWLQEEGISPLSIQVINTLEKVDIGGKPVHDGDDPPIIPPGTPQYENITVTTTEIVPNVDMPDLSGLTDQEITMLIPTFLNGIRQVVVASENKVDEYSWNNVTKRLVPNQPLLPGDDIFIIWPVSD